MVQLPDFVVTALSKPIRDGSKFTDEISSLRNILSSLLQVSIKHETDMNYNSGHSLRFVTRVKKFGSSRNSKGSLFEIMVFVSAKSQLFAIYCFDRQQLLSHAPFPLIAPNHLPKSILEICERVHHQLKISGFQEVAFEILDLPAPNCVTELDNLPATVFQALFAEII
jgi:hypothetical protein